MDSIEGKNRIFSIAFEGMHRVGKETQMELLQKKIQAAGIPCISIKGEGYRYGAGEQPKDPQSDFWEKISEQLNKGADPAVWDEASYRLARELIVWRDRILSRQIDKTLAPFGVLLVDRSLISRAIAKSVDSPPPPKKIFSSEELFPQDVQHRKEITPEMVLPDAIVELVAPKEVLLARLDATDPEYEFRKSNIESKFDIYTDAKHHLSPEIQSRIVTVDSSASVDEVYNKIAEELKTRFPELSFLHEEERQDHD